MARKIVITEEQYNKVIKEGVTLNADVSAAGGDVKRAVSDTKREAQKSGVDLNNATIQIQAKDANESKIIKKGDLQKERLKVLKENSEVYTVKDFFQKMKQKKLNEDLDLDLTPTQMRNILGIYDDDELNAAVMAEENEDLEEKIWKTLCDTFNTRTLRTTTVHFKDVVKVLKDKFGFEYSGCDRNNESHDFTDGKRELSIFPKMFYSKQDEMNINNISVF